MAIHKRELAASELLEIYDALVQLDRRICALRDSLSKTMPDIYDGAFVARIAEALFARLTASLPRLPNTHLTFLVLRPRRVGRLAADDGLQHLHIRDVFRWNFQRIAIKQNQVRQFANLQRACGVVLV